MKYFFIFNDFGENTTRASVKSSMQQKHVIILTHTPLPHKNESSAFASVLKVWLQLSLLTFSRELVVLPEFEINRFLSLKNHLPFPIGFILLMPFLHFLPFSFYHFLPLFSFNSLVGRKKLGAETLTVLSP